MNLHNHAVLQWKIPSARSTMMNNTFDSTWNNNKSTHAEGMVVYLLLLKVHEKGQA